MGWIKSVSFILNRENSRKIYTKVKVKSLSSFIKVIARIIRHIKRARIRIQNKVVMSLKNPLKKYLMLKKKDF